MVELLKQRPQRPGDIAARLKLNAPLVSRHLKVLRASGLVESTHPEFDTRVRIYALKPQMLGELKTWLAEIEAMWAGQLAGFKAHIEGKP
jgi:DNA-binding transcriptional ArsR family regulator